MNWTKEKDDDGGWIHFLGHPKDGTWGEVVSFSAFGAKRQYRASVSIGLTEAQTTRRSLKEAKLWCKCAVDLLSSLEKIK